MPERAPGAFARLGGGLREGWLPWPAVVFSVPIRRLFVLFLMLWLWPLAAGAAPLQPVPLSPQLKSQPLDWNFTIYRDEQGRLDMEGARAALAEGRFQRPLSGSPGFGYLQGALWVHLALVNDSAAPLERWLEWDWPYQQLVTLYVIRGDGRVERANSGSMVPIDQRPLHARQILFPVNVAPGEQVQCFIRVSGLSPTIASLALWEPATYADYGRRYMAIRYLLLASMMVFVVFTLITWQALQRPLLLMGVVSDLLLVLLVFIADGHLLGSLIPAGEGLWQSRASAFVIFAIIATHLVFTLDFLDIKARHPRLHRLFLGLIVFSFTCALFFLLVPVPHIAALIQQVVLLILIGSAFYMSLFGSRIARLYLLAWGTMWLFLGLRMVSIMGYIPLLPFMHNLPLIGLALSSLVLSYAMFSDVRRAREELERSQRTLLQQQFKQQQQLEAAVESRTRELEWARVEAEKSSVAKSAFVSMINHELRGPLHTILGYADLLTKDIPEHLAYRMRILENSGKQLLRLIDDLLTFSRGEVDAIKLVPETVDLDALVYQLKEAYQLVAARNGNELLFELSGGLPPAIEADGQRLQQVMNNLIGNACKFCRHGKITVAIERLAALESDDEHVRLRFSVIDEGVGIAPEFLGRIFEPFMRADEKQRQPGVGLGLAIARQIVRAMGGDIQVISTPGKGSRFFFTLKLKPLEATQESVRRFSDITGYRGPLRTLLIVDDVTNNRELLNAYCQRWHFRALLAADGQQAFAKFQARRDEIDGILTDQFMPVEDGWDLLRRVRETPGGGAVPVILVSAAPPQRPQGFPPDMHFDALLMKPILPEDLAEVLANCLSLDWVYREKPAIPAAAKPVKYPSAEELAALLHEIEEGRVLAIQRRLDMLLHEYPEYSTFVREAQRLNKAFEFEELKRLIARAGG